jgi:uncharacterized membrane protein
LLNSISTKPKTFLAIILIVQFAMLSTVLLDIPVARQILVFLYLTFVPGFVILKLLKMNEQNLLQTIIFSVGLSVAITMLLGLAINISIPTNIMAPLSIFPLITIFSIFVTAAAFAAFLRNTDIRTFETKFNPKNLLLILPFGILILSIVGIMFVNAYQNNLLIMISIVTISLTFIISLFYKQLSIQKYYPIIILIIALSLLLQFSLFSNYIHGPDCASEFPPMRLTMANHFWDFSTDLRTDSMLSLTIFPTIYSTMSNMDLTWTYKIVYPLIFSIVPLVLYELWQMYISKKYAFIAAFVFIAEPTFYNEMLSLTRQMIAELFFVLLLFVILKKEMKTIYRTLLFVLFSFGLIVSHYAMAELFLGIIAVMYLISLIVPRFSKGSIKGISATLVLLFFAMMFGWYLYTAGGSVFESFVSFGQNIYNQLGDFANPASRGETVLTGLGLTTSPTIWNSISRVFAYSIEAFIVIGFIGLISKRVKTNYDLTITAFTTIFIGLLAALIIVPGFASSLNMSRFYTFLLFFLAPLSVIGAEIIARIISKPKTKTLATIFLTIVLVGYFLFQSGFIYEMTGTENYSLTLNGFKSGARLAITYGVVTKTDVAGAQWLEEHTNNATVYTGHVTPIIEYGPLGYSSLNLNGLIQLSNTSLPVKGDFVYLATLNTIYGVVVGFNAVYNTTSLQQSVYPSANSIYSSHNCQIYAFSGP